MKRYCIEIYEPESTRDVLVSFYSDDPFLAISQEDAINLAAFPEGQTSLPGCLRVTRVEHLLFESESGAKHKLCVYTARVQDAETYLLG